MDGVGVEETFTAVLLGALHDRARKGEGVRGLPAGILAQLLGVATLAAAITCERSGAGSPTAAELDERRFMER